jgi:acyl-CoA thioesterase-1
LNARLSRNRNGNLTFAFIGGSNTEGFGASDPDQTSWRALTEQYLKERFGEKRVSCINAGVGGTTSAFGAFRLQEHVLSHGPIDLLFVEFAINDDQGREESIRGMEGIVRQCRRLSPGTDIVFLHLASVRNLAEEMPMYIAAHEEVASYYGLPSVNFSSPLYGRIGAGEFAWSDLAPDGSHPNDAGYAIYAEYVRDFLEAALKETGSEQGVECDMDPALESELPPPLDPGSYEYAAMRSIGLALSAKGFARSEEAPTPLINWRYGIEYLEADAVDAGLVFETDGRGTGLVLLCGPDTGIFEYSLDGGDYLPVNLFDEWCLGAYRPVIALFPPCGERGTRRIAIRNTVRTDDRSKGTCLRILKLLSY